MRPDQNLLDKVVAPGLISDKHGRKPARRGQVARRELLKCHRTSARVAHASRTRPERRDPLCEGADPLKFQRPAPDADRRPGLRGNLIIASDALLVLEHASGPGNQ